MSVSIWMKRGGFPHFEVSELGLLAVAEFPQEDANLVFMGDKASGMNRECSIQGFERLGELFLVGEQIIALLLARVVLPRSMGNGKPMKFEALVLFAVAGGDAPLIMVNVGPEEVFCQKTTGGNDENACRPEEQVEARSRGKGQRGRGIGISGFPKYETEQNAEGGPSDDDGAGRTGGKLEKGFRKKGKAGSDETESKTEAAKIAFLCYPSRETHHYHILPAVEFYASSFDCTDMVGTK